MMQSKFVLFMAAGLSLTTMACQKEEASSDADSGATPRGGSGGQPSTPDSGLNGGNQMNGGAGGEGVGNGGAGGDIVEPPIGGDGGGGGGGGGAGGNNINPPGDIPKGGVCDPADDQCDRGLVCVNNGVDEAMVAIGVCLSLCDTKADPNGCENDELCSPFEECAADAASCEGFCIPSDDCEVSDPSLACGGPASCFFLPPITLCDTTEGTAIIGDECGLSDPEPATHCAPGLACVGGLCEAACGEADACGEGEVCVDYGPQVNDLNFKVCHKQCDAHGQLGCTAEEVCVVGTVADIGGEGTAIGYCVTGDFTQGVDTQNQPCTPTADGSTYWGSCTAGHICDTLGLPMDDMCMGFCTAGDTSLCTDNSACLQGIFRTEGLGVCLGNCDVWGANDACGEGNTCAFLTFGNEDTALIGLCFEGEATVATGEVCEVTNEDFGVSNCEVGHICGATMAGGDTTCIKLCEVAPETPNGCPAGLMCRTGIFGADQNAMGGNERFGICQPNQ